MLSSARWRGNASAIFVITHTHRDHSPAARNLKELTGAPTYGFGPHGSGRPDHGGEVEEGADREFDPDVRVRDGERIEGDGWTLEAVHTPGHTSNHLCYAFAEENALFSGDHVMGWSTTVVSPPDGDMQAYMRSLERLMARDEEVYWPTHGSSIPTPAKFVGALLAHRHEREEPDHGVSGERHVNDSGDGGDDVRHCRAPPARGGGPLGPVSPHSHGGNRPRPLRRATRSGIDLSTTLSR